MLVVLVAAFGVCWLPLHVFTIVIDLAPELLDIRTAAQERLFFIIFYSCHWLAMANSVSNPIIYCFLNDRFQVYNRIGGLCNQLIKCSTYTTHTYKHIHHNDIWKG